MTRIHSTRTLTPARQRLFRLMANLYFGRIEQLVVRDGEPVLDPLPTLVRVHKFAGQNSPRPDQLSTNLVLKEQHLDFLRLLDTVGTGTIAVIDVQHGLPFKAEVPA